MIILEADVIPMILATKKRRTNIRADDAVLVLRFINEKLQRRPWGKRKSLTLQTYRIAVELGISKSRVKHAKELLSSLGIIEFGGTVYNKTTKFFVKLWNLSVFYSRYAYVWNPNGKVITESRPGKKVNPDHLRFKLVSKTHAKLSEAGLDSDTQYDSEYPWLYEKQKQSALDRIAGIKKASKSALQKAKKLSSDIFYFNLDAASTELGF